MRFDLSRKPDGMTDDAWQQIVAAMREPAPEPAVDLPTAPRRNKYNVAPAEERRWNGRTYASKAEMLYAQDLWTQREGGAIVEYIEQPRCWLGVALNVYVPDFFVVGGGTCWYVDVKGRTTAKFARDKKLWREYGRHPLHVVARKRGRFEVTEIIEPQPRRAA